MRKREIVGRIARRTSLPEEAVRIVLTGLRDELIVALAEGQVVALDALGRFRMARQQRSAPCELTGSLGSRVYVSFRAARGLKEELTQARAGIEAEVCRLRSVLDRNPLLAARLAPEPSRRSPP